MKKILFAISVLWVSYGWGQNKILAEAAIRYPVDTLVNTVLFNFAMWGDSQFEIAPGTSYQVNLKTGRYSFNGGIAGESAFQIKTRMVADVAKHSWNTIIWAGRNGVLNTATSAIMSSIRQMTDSLSHGRYIVLTVIHGGGEGTGTPAHDSIQRLNDSIIAQYGSRSLDINAYLKTLYNPSLPQDIATNSQDVIPWSIRSDSIHLTPFYYRIVGDYIISQKLNVITPTGIRIPSVNGVANSLNGTSDGSFNSFSVSDKNYFYFKSDGRNKSAELTLYQSYAGMNSQAVNNYSFTSDLSGWTTGGNWTFANGGATHSTGNTTSLTQSVTVEADATYLITVASSNASAGQINNISFLGFTKGGQVNGVSSFAFYSPTATSSTISINPSSTYNGTVDSVSIRRIDKASFIPSIPIQFALKDTFGNPVVNYAANRNGIIGIGGYSLNNNPPFTRVTDKAGSSLAIGNGTANQAAMVTNSTLLGNNVGSYGTTILSSTLIGSRLFNSSNATYIEKNTALGESIYTGNTAYENIGIGTDLHTGTTTFNRSLMIGTTLSFPSTSEAGQVNIKGLIFGRGATATGTSAAGRVGIGTNSPDASSILDLTSTGAGLLIPRMTTSQAGAIPSRATGLMFLNTDSTYRPMVFNGTIYRGLRFTDESAVSSSGDYTPTVTGVANLISSSGETATYYRMGDKVHIDGSFSVSLTALVSTTINISMPFASNFTTITDAKGMCNFVATTSNGATVTADTTNDLITLNFTAVNTSGVVNFSLSYTVK